MRTLLYLFSFITLVSCHSLNINGKDYNSDSDCSKNVFIQYRKPNKNITSQMIANKSNQTITVFLESYFNGIIQGYIGEKMIFNENVVTEESLGTTGKYFIYDYL